MSNTTPQFCDCTVRCGDDARLASGGAVACASMRAALRAMVQASVVSALLAELGHPDALGALQELKAMRNARTTQGLGQ